MKKCIILMTGGIESTTMAYLKKNEGELLKLVFFDYGQRSSIQELRASVEISKRLGMEQPEIFDLRNLGLKFQNLNKLHVPLPHRNLVLLSLSIGIAETYNIKTILFGLNKDDTQKDQLFREKGSTIGYQTGSSQFLSQFKTITNLINPEIMIETPLIEYTKSQILHIGQNLDIPFQLTYSCMTGKDKHCGSCLQCKDRIKNFASANLKDPAMQHLPQFNY